MIKQGVLRGKDKGERLAFRRLRLQRKKGFRVRAKFWERRAINKGQMHLEYSYGEINPGKRHWYNIDLTPSEAKKVIDALQARLDELDSLDVYNSSVEE